MDLSARRASTAFAGGVNHRSSLLQDPFHARRADTTPVRHSDGAIHVLRLCYCIGPAGLGFLEQGHRGLTAPAEVVPALRA